MSIRQGRVRAAFDILFDRFSPTLVGGGLFVSAFFGGFLMQNSSVNVTTIFGLIGICWALSLVYVFQGTRRNNERIQAIGTQFSEFQEYTQQLVELIKKMNDLLVKGWEPAADCEAVTSEIAAKFAEHIEQADKFRKIVETQLETTYHGKQTIDELVGAMNDIGEGNATLLTDIEATNNEFSDILRIIDEIAEKTKIINEIVFQTKLLSFNASVEAARAGEHGKGFAVVAEEIGNLARMSGESAQKISQILKAGTDKVQEIMLRSKERGQALIDKSSSNIATGTQVAKRSESSYENIIQAGLKTNEMVAAFFEAVKADATAAEKIRTVFSHEASGSVGTQLTEQLSEIVAALESCGTGASSSQELAPAESPDVDEDRGNPAA